MSTLEARTGYGDRHHKACDCHDCCIDRLVGDLTEGLWTESDPEDLYPPAVAPVASPQVQNRKPLEATVDAAFKDVDDRGDQ